MGVSKVMFSPVQGIVLQGGKPVSGAKVVREYSWAWNDAERKDEAVTDASGRFQFPLATKASLLTSIFPHEPVIHQKITIVHNGKEFLAWRFSKHNYDENGELRGKKIDLKCDLDNKKGFHINEDIYGICVLN